MRSIRTSVAILLATLFTTVFATPSAWTQVPVEFEGPVTAIDPDVFSQSPHFWVEVMGVRFEIARDLEILGPTRPLRPEELLGNPLPGRSLPGFLGGTAILSGRTLASGRVLVSSLDLDPAENLLSGVLDENPGAGRLRVLGLVAQPVGDPRLPTRMIDERHFDIDPGTIPVGSFVSANGYFGEDGIFRYHTLEAAGELVGDPIQTSIARARVDAAGELDLRGYSTTPTGTVQVLVEKGIWQHWIAQVDVVPDADDPRFGTFRLRQALTLRPDRVRVINSNGSSKVVPVD